MFEHKTKYFFKSLHRVVGSLKLKQTIFLTLSFRRPNKIISQHFLEQIELLFKKNCRRH